MTIKAMDHFTIVTDRLPETCQFYCELGLEQGPRPDFGIDGAWLYANSRPVLHVIVVAVMPEPRRGTLDHMAFSADGLASIAAKLEGKGVAYKLIRTPRPFTRWQLFFKDPNGVDIELDFDAGEAAPDGWQPDRRVS